MLDFLGQMWAPILFNFVTTLMTIVGLFGAKYDRKSYLMTFAMYQIVSFAWNAFVIAFYMELGELRRDSDYLNLGTSHSNDHFASTNR